MKTIITGAVLIVIGLFILERILGQDAGERSYIYFDDMYQSVAFKEQSENPHLAQGVTQQSPPDGTIPRGYTPLHYGIEEEELAAVRKDAPYYWRVKAVHSTAVSSEWSAPSPFHVGFSLAPPGWLLYVLIGIGVLFLGFLAFWLGRRTAYYEGEP